MIGDIQIAFTVGREIVDAAGDGARIALLNRRKREEAQEIAHWIRYIETAADPNFQDEFARATHLPHQTDSFSHLAGLLPEKRG